MLDALRYYGAALATLAALIIALDMRRRITGWGFMLFVTNSIVTIA
ncbi:MAG TPA: hypothetical protein VF463_12200 [Sphingobium sp.]